MPRRSTRSSSARALSASPVKEAALAHGLPVFQPERIKRPEVVAQLAELPAEAMVVVGYGQIIPQSIINKMDMGLAQILKAEYGDIAEEETADLPEFASQAELDAYIAKLETTMREAAKKFEFEKAARLRDSIDAGGTELPVDERRLTRARRAVDKAAAVLAEPDDD